MKATTSTTGLRWFAALAGLCLVLSSGWADEPQEQEKAKKPQDKTLSAKVNRDPIRVTRHPFVPQLSEDYTIGPQDVLAINVWKEPEISRTVPVRPDGKISLPLVGDILASGHTPVQLKREIAERLKNYLSDPEVTVIVQSVNSRRFNVVGGVASPGTYDLTKRMTVLDAIAQAGGPVDFAKVKKIYILRLLKNGERLRILFNYKQVIKGKNFHQNVDLEPGDTIVIP